VPEKFDLSSTTDVAITADYPFNNAECCGPYKFVTSLVGFENPDINKVFVSDTFPCDDILAHQITAIQTATTNFTLLPYRHYDLTVQVVTANEKTEKIVFLGNSVNIRALTKSGIPAVPQTQDIKTNSISNVSGIVSFDFTFDQCTGNNTNFTVTLVPVIAAVEQLQADSAPIDCFDLFKQPDKKTTLNFTFDNMVPSHNYLIKLIAMSDGGASEYSGDSIYIAALKNGN
jgi:hypothetical protein